jgi:transcriptional regulator with XRE-family HTH domain
MLGKFVRACRKAKGMSRADLACATDGACSESVIRDVELGIRIDMRGSSIKALCAALGIDPADIVGLIPLRKRAAA